MSNDNTMSKTPKPTSTPHDWSRFDTMTGEERHAAALSDPDAQPLTPEDFKRMERTPQVRVIRRALGLSQEEFATRFHIPLGTLRDWEQGRKDPDTAARAYLRVIGHNPAAVIEALKLTP
jgi:putative transcriptional regulator